MAQQRDDTKTRRKKNLVNPGRRSFLKGVGLVGAGTALIDHLKLDAGVAEAATKSQAQEGKVKISLDINGRKRDVAVEPRTTLLSAMRDYLDPAVTGPKLVCGQGTCGACTVLFNGVPVYSCLTLAVDAVGKKVTTAEGLGTPEKPNPIQAAFVDKDGMMCGFCTPGFITTLSAYLSQNPHPTADQVREACQGNFCRCGTYPRVFEAALTTGGKRASINGTPDSSRGN